MGDHMNVKQINESINITTLFKIVRVKHLTE